MLTNSDYIMLLDNAIKKKHSIAFSCYCRIEYNGRVESFLAEGDRMVLIKGDNTLIIHQPKGNNPVNYMKPGTSFSLSHADGIFHLRCTNLQHKEYLDLYIHKIYFFNSHKLEDGQSIQVRGTEKDMADMIFENPDIVEKGFKPLSMEEHTKHGFIDVFGIDKHNTLTLIECKRQAGDLSAVTQLRRYVEKIKESKGLQNVRGILVCPKISKNALSMLNDWGYKHVALDPPKYMERYDRKQKSLLHF